MHRASVLLRMLRTALLTRPTRSAAAPIQPLLNRRVYDCRKSADLLNRLVRKEGSKAAKDVAVNQAYDHSGTTFNFFAKVFGRSSVDNANLPLTSSVHYQEDSRFGYDNAFWDGRQMVDGDGFLFNPMTQSLDIVAHELSHGVTPYGAALKGASRHTGNALVHLISSRHTVDRTACTPGVRISVSIRKSDSDFRSRATTFIT